MELDKICNRFNDILWITHPDSWPYTDGAARKCFHRMRRSPFDVHWFTISFGSALMISRLIRDTEITFGPLGTRGLLTVGLIWRVGIHIHFASNPLPAPLLTNPNWGWDFALFQTKGHFPGFLLQSRLLLKEGLSPRGILSGPPLSPTGAAGRKFATKLFASNFNLLWRI